MFHIFVIFKQAKYDANQEANKKLLPVSKEDLLSFDHGSAALEKSHANGIMPFPVNSDYQYRGNNVLTDHFQYSRQTHALGKSSNQYDV